MKLTDTTEFQEDDGHLYGEPTVSFTFKVRDEEEGELVEKDFTFSHAKEWDKWTLMHYVEKRCDANSMISRRNWRTVEDVHWDKAHLSEADIDIPQYVIDKLDEMMEMDIMRIQL